MTCKGRRGEWILQSTDPPQIRSLRNNSQIKGHDLFLRGWLVMDYMDPINPSTLKLWSSKPSARVPCIRVLAMQHGPSIPPCCGKEGPYLPPLFKEAKKRHLVRWCKISAFILKSFMINEVWVAWRKGFPKFLMVIEGFYDKAFDIGPYWLL